MPRRLVPIRNTSHRVAALALYRALLSQCKAAPLQDEQRTAAHNLVRNTFRRNVNVQGRFYLSNAFTAGYKALHHLDASTDGTESSTSTLLQLLARAPSYMTTSPPKPSSKPTTASPPRPTPPSILSRPRALTSLTSPKRHVPILVSANRIPILRIKKPQPLTLSMYLKRRVKTRQARHELKDALEEMVHIAKLEDRWDGIVRVEEIVRRRSAGKEGKTPLLVDEGRDKDVREPKWRDGAQDAVQYVWDQLDGEGKRNIEWARRMVEVVDREKEMAERERRIRQMKRNDERRARKELRDRGVSAVVEEREGIIEHVEERESPAELVGDREGGRVKDAAWEKWSGQD